MKTVYDVVQIPFSFGGAYGCGYKACVIATCQIYWLAQQVIATCKSAWHPLKIVERQQNLFFESKEA